MRDPTPEFPRVLEIFNLSSKRDLEKHCKWLVLHQIDFVTLILAAQHGALEPYQYANHFDRRVPTHLHPNEGERSAFQSNGVGAFRSKAAAKFASKVFQLFDEQRSLAAHLFFTPCHTYWYLFYFDNCDTAGDHWEHGSHIHLVSWQWPNLRLDAVWAKVQAGEFSFSNKIHLRYQRSGSET